MEIGEDKRSTQRRPPRLCLCLMAGRGAAILGAACPHTCIHAPTCMYCTCMDPTQIRLCREAQYLAEAEAAREEREEGQMLPGFPDADRRMLTAAELRL